MSCSCPTPETDAEKQDLFDLSTRKVYLAPDITIGAVSSYLTFSPLPPTQLSFNFLIR